MFICLFCFLLFLFLFLFLSYLCINKSECFVVCTLDLTDPPPTWRVYFCADMFIHMSIHGHVGIIHSYIHTHICLCIHTCQLWACHRNVYTYTGIHIHIHIHIYASLDTSTHMRLLLSAVYVCTVSMYM
jgi:hypothetical protein